MGAMDQQEKINNTVREVSLLVGTSSFDKPGVMMYNISILTRKYEFMKRRLVTMARSKLNGGEKSKTTIVTFDTLLKRLEGHQFKNQDDNQTMFITRALVNQLEREGDFEIRDMLIEEGVEF